MITLFIIRKKIINIDTKLYLYFFNKTENYIEIMKIKRKIQKSV